MAAKRSGKAGVEIRVPGSDHPRVVVVGGGFAGNRLVRGLAGAPYQVVQIDENNFHQFQPLLYQVASCGLEPDAIIFPLRKLVQDYGNVRFRMARVEEIDTAAKRVRTDAGSLAYDHLVLATGSTSNFFGNAELEAASIGMKDIREALDIRSRLLTNLELAASTCDEAEREALTNVVIVGGGPAGVEMAGALAEFRTHILEKDYPDLLRELFRIVLVQSGDRLLKGMSLHAANRARADLDHLGVELVFGNRVVAYGEGLLRTDTGLEIPAGTLIWTAGVKGQFPAGLSPDVVARGNRINVDPLLAVEGQEGIYAIGDVACLSCEGYPRGHPGVAQVAIQQGALLAENFLRLARGEEPRPFVYADRGSMATIGRNRAVADIGRFQFGGIIAWLLWSVIHVVSLVGFRNKLFTLLNWGMSYVSYEKGHRFIVRRPGGWR